MSLHTHNDDISSSSRSSDHSLSSSEELITTTVTTAAGGETETCSYVNTIDSPAISNHHVDSDFSDSSSSSSVTSCPPPPPSSNHNHDYDRTDSPTKFNSFTEKKLKPDSSLKEKYNTLKKKFSTAKHENQILKTKVKSLENSLTSFKSQNARIQKDLLSQSHKTQETSIRLQNQLNETQGENILLKNQIDSLNVQLEHTQKASTQNQHHYDKIQQEWIRNTTQAQSDKIQLMNQLDFIKNENSNLKSQLNIAQAQNSINSGNNPIQNEYANLSTKLNLIEKNSRKQKEEFQSTVKQIRLLNQEENERLQKLHKEELVEKDEQIIILRKELNRLVDGMKRFQYMRQLEVQQQQQQNEQTK